MRELVILRHSCTKKGPGRGKGSHLSADGVALARETAAGLGPFDLVLASDVPRTMETAIAMGYAVDDLLAVPPELAAAAFDVLGHQDRWGWDAPWARFAALVGEGSAVAQLGTWLRDTWVAALDSVPAGGRVLVVSHGRMIEAGVVACLVDAPGPEFAAWGQPLHHCEGVTLSYRDGRFGEPRISRARRCRSGEQ